MSTTLISKTQQKNELGKVLINTYFLDKKKLVKHQLDGFDNFIDTKLYIYARSITLYWGMATSLSGASIPRDEGTGHIQQLLMKGNKPAMSLTP